jgi:hypothetical protein
LTPSVGQPRYVWADADANGYGKLVPSDQSSTDTEIPSLKGMVLGDRVRLRAAPNTNSKILNHYNKGVSLDVLQRYSSGQEQYYWFNVGISGRTGWMYGEFVGIPDE